MSVKRIATCDGCGVRKIENEPKEPEPNIERFTFKHVQGALGVVQVDLCRPCLEAEQERLQQSIVGRRLIIHARAGVFTAPVAPKPQPQPDPLPYRGGPWPGFLPLKSQ